MKSAKRTQDQSTAPSADTDRQVKDWGFVQQTYNDIGESWRRIAMQSQWQVVPPATSLGG